MTLTDDLLRDEIGQGLRPAQIAAKYGLSRQGVSKRVNRLKFTQTAVAVVAKHESRRYVNLQLDAMEQMTHSFARVKLLMDASDAWLRDADNPEIYNIGPRGDEIMVTYWEFAFGEAGYGDDAPKMVKRKATLQELLRRVERGGTLTDRAEAKFADPRDLILKTAQEVRQTVGQCVELAQMLADARAMETFREALLTEIGKVSPQVAENIATAVRRVLVLHSAAGGPEAVPL